MMSIRLYISTIIKKTTILALISILEKLALVLATSIQVIDDNEKIVKMLCIYYLIRF